MSLNNEDNNDLASLSLRIMWMDVLFTLVRRKKLIVVIVFSVMVITAGITLLIPKSYKSTAVVLLPEKTGTLLDVLSTTGGGDLGSIGASILGGGTPSHFARYIAIMNSRRLREDLITRFDLMSVYDVEEMDDALEILEDNLESEADKKLGTINITFHFEQDPDKTSAVANYAVSKLDEINRELATEQARSTREFIERRYEQSKMDLQNAEDSLNMFQKSFDIISIPEQIKAAIEAAADLQAQLATTEIEYNVKRKTLGEKHPDLLRLESQIAELRKTRKRMDIGAADFGVFIPFKKAPDLGLRYFRLYRDVIIKEKIVEFLVPQFEQAKIQEARDTPTLFVLDYAKPADRAYKPKKKLITFLVGILTGILTVLFLYIREYVWPQFGEAQSKLKEILPLLKPRNWLA